MRVCWFGIYDPKYNRNSVLISGLRQNQVEVIECRGDGKGLVKYVLLICNLRALRNEYDILFCAFPVHISIILARIFQSKPIVSDAFISVFDAEVNDRGKVSKYNPLAWFYWLLDYLLVKLSAHCLVDTEAHQELWSRFRSRTAITVVPVGVNTDEYFPISDTKNKSDACLVQFHGSFIPLQGVGHILEAARILKDDPNVCFRFIGRGQTYQEAVNLINEYQLNIELLPWLSTNELNERLNEADIILGIFGDTQKAERVVPNKVYQGTAVRKPVITKDTPAIRAEFSEAELILCTNDPKDIANTIKKLCAAPEQRATFASNGYKKCIEKFNQRVIGAQLKKVCEKILV